MKSQNKQASALLTLAFVALNFSISTTPVKADTVKTENQSLHLPKPFATKSSTNFTKVLGWPAGKTPVAPAGFTVTKFADKFINPRNIYVAPNNDIFVSEANTEIKGVLKIGADIIGASKAERLDESANRITLLRDTNNDGNPDLRTTFLTGLNQPFGMLIIKNYFYVANTNGLWRYPYKQGDTAITQAGEKILDLPNAGLNIHWTRNLIANKDNSKIYIAVGSGSNVGESGMEIEVRRANILEINPDGSGERIYASGIRNPVGMDWSPVTNTLWASVNERDGLGDDLVPDYLTSVKENGFYGWPYSYYGKLEPRIKKEEQRLDLVEKAIIPEVPLGNHTASLGLAFYKGKSFPKQYHNGAFIGQHGSWNRSEINGYKVVFVPFKEGKPFGRPEDFLTGFIANVEKNEVYGRPVDTAILSDGSLLVSDDTANTIWRVSKQ